MAKTFSSFADRIAQAYQRVERQRQQRIVPDSGRHTSMQPYSGDRARHDFVGAVPHVKPVFARARDAMTTKNAVIVGVLLAVTTTVNHMADQFKDVCTVDAEGTAYRVSPDRKTVQQNSAMLVDRTGKSCSIGAGSGATFYDTIDPNSIDPKYLPSGFVTKEQALSDNIDRQALDFVG